MRPMSGLPGRPPRVGVCSWSLRAGSACQLAERVREVGVRCVQIALDPLRRGESGWAEGQTIDALRGAGIEVVSGMMGMEGEDYSTLESIARTGGVRPDSTWESNLAAAEENAQLASRMGLRLVTFHAGFIPHESGRARKVMLERLRTLAEAFGRRGIRVGFETGQESADTLLAALTELDDLMSGGEAPRVGVNFDPANMILYGMGDPARAARRLAGRIVQVHIKDAVPATRSGEWGSEVRVGTGAVDWRGFFGALRDAGVECDLVIEREAGEHRVEDARAALELVGRMGEEA